MLFRLVHGKWNDYMRYRVRNPDMSRGMKREPIHIMAPYQILFGPKISTRHAPDRVHTDSNEMFGYHLELMILGT